MALAHFKALNESSDESDGDEENPSITREALEEKAMSEYTKVLILQRNKQWKEAESGFKALLESDVLSRATGTVNYVSGRIQPSLEHLKYCLLVNLAHVLTQVDQVKEALDYYLEAVALDDTDLNLWFRIGRAAMKVPNLNLASYAFQEALHCNESHWPSLDTLITVLYAVSNYMYCLYYISEGLKIDPDFYKGIAFCQRIYKDHPSFERDFPLYYPQCKLDDTVLKRDLKAEVDMDMLDKMFDEVETLRKKHETLKWPAENKDDILASVRPDQPLRKKCWVTVGRALLQIYAKLKEEYPEVSFFRTVDLADESSEPAQPNAGTDSDVDWYAAGDNTADEEVARLNDASDKDRAEGEDAAGARNKRRRSSPSLLDQWMTCSKRRSARVRSTVRREEPSLARTLRQLLPQYLWPSRDEVRSDADPMRWAEDSMDTMDLYRLFESKEGGGGADRRASQQAYKSNALSDEERTRLIEEEKYFNTDEEINEVNDFIKENSGKNILLLIDSYVKTVSKRWNIYWPPALNAIYLKIYKLIRQHFPEASQTSESLELPAARALLLYGELLLDRWLWKGKEQGLPSPLTGSAFGGEFCSLSFGDLSYVCCDLEDPVFIVRCYWLETLMYLHAQKKEASMIVLERYCNDERCCDVEVKLKNVNNHSVVSQDLVERLYNTLKRNEGLDKVRAMFSNGEYETVVSILTASLHPNIPLLVADFVEPIIDRCTQFSLLLDSLFELEKYEESFIWCELASHEALGHYRSSLEDTSGTKSKWVVLLTNTLQALPVCIEQGGCDIIGKLPHSKLVRLIQTMSNVICHQMETSDSPEIPLETIAPWVVIYHIARYDEEKTGRVFEDEDVPGSLFVLFTAHEYLGKRSWCCIDEAEILYKILNALRPMMEPLSPDCEMMKTLGQQVEQVFYCLYGHPIKKNKPRYIQEHNVMGLALTWTRSRLVYHFLRPCELPMYDSSSRCSISLDTEALFRRIIGLVPNENDPARLVKGLNLYIAGESNQLPVNKDPLPTEITDIYYLIADNYFKNKSWSKALEYYALDVCANPNRVDSWACLALARGSQLETKLNSCEPLRSEVYFLKCAQMACRCYQRSLQLDPEQSTLWIEYGSFSYMVHSFCSRLLKQEQNLSLERFDVLEKQKEQTLDMAFKCFTSANTLWVRLEKSCDEPEIQDERWLHHYMLGKISMKREESPKIYLDHFIKAMRFLHKNNAQYPENISHSNPQYYSVEALELYYRVHACILKALEQSEDQSIGVGLRQLFFETLEKTASGPFANFGDILNDCFLEDSKTTQVPLVDSDVSYLMNNIVMIISGDESVCCKRKCQEMCDDSSESSHIQGEDSRSSKKLKKDNVVVKSDKVSDDSNRPLKRQKSKESESSDTKHDNSCDNTDKSEDGKKVSKKPKGQESSSETLSDSEMTTSESDSSSSSTSEEESNSACSETSQDSSEEDKPPPNKKAKMAPKVDRGNWKEEQRCLIDRCLWAMAECVRRFPEHYKSLYRQAHYHFRSKVRTDVDKVHRLLLGEGGLFADRKPNNFFNGVWRIPSSEIDRSGSFAGHMSRCSHLLLDLLRDSRDIKMLMDLSLQLKDTPEPDKKYLRDEEREQLAKESLSLSVQALRRKLTEAKDLAQLRSIVMETYKAFKRINKCWPQRDNSFSGLVTQAYTRYLKMKGDFGKSNFEAASKFCLQEINQSGNNSGTGSQPNINVVPVAYETNTQTEPSTPVASSTITVTPITVAPTIAPPVSISTNPMKPTPAPTSVSVPVKRSRGRPTNVSIRHPNPTSIMKSPIPSAKDLQMLYQNLSYTNQNLLPLLRANPYMGMSPSQLNFQAEFMKQVSNYSKQQSSKATSTAATLPTSKIHPNITITPVNKSASPSAPQQTNRPKTYSGKTQSASSAAKTNKHSQPMAYSKAAMSAAVPGTPINKTLTPSSSSLVNNRPIPSQMGTSHIPSTENRSLQHKLLSAKKPKLTMGQEEKEMPSSGSSEKETSKRTSQSSSSSASNKTPLDVTKSVNEEKFKGGVVISKLPPKAASESKPVMKDMGLTVNTCSAGLQTALSSLSPKEITLMRISQTAGNSAASSDSESKKTKSLPLPQVQPPQDESKAPPVSLWKPVNLEPHISSALAAIGTQLTITPSMATTATSAVPESKKQHGAAQADAIKYDKAEVSIQPVVEKQKKDPCEIITLE